MMRLSKNFTLAELCKSNKAKELGLDNTPTALIADKLLAVVENVLQPARDALGLPIHTNSGYRSDAVNKAVGGAKNSQHEKGEAVDIELGGKTKEENEILFNWIRDNCEFDQLINERDFSWVHVSYKCCGNRNQILKL